jgi:sulfopyruvate decarboxylase TPP-binding subunit
MKQSDAESIGNALADAGFDFAATLPATQIHTLQAWLAESPKFMTVPVTNEGEGVAICAGAWMAGKMPVIVLETSGILLSTYALMRCHATFGIPTLMLSTYRGGLGDQEWYSVHTGAVLPQLLQSLRIPCRVVDKVDDIATAFVDARRSMDAAMHPVSIVMDVRLTDRE